MNRNEGRKVEEKGTELESLIPAFTQVQRNEIANNFFKKTPRLDRTLKLRMNDSWV